MSADGAPLSGNVAAVDLGSNSFHMLIARLNGRAVEVVDRIREPVRLAAGLDPEGRISEEAVQRALECLQRFGQRLRHLPPAHVRAVGTNTLRRAHSDSRFRSRASQALGHRVEIISGEEEARLIYLGVAQTHSSAGRRLVVDIGGGSTEVIIGDGIDVVRAHSLYMGCVTFSRRYFPQGEVRRDYFRLAETAAGLEIRAVRSGFKDLGWDAAVGASGTVNALSEILRLNDLVASDAPGITLSGLKKLRRLLVTSGDMERVTLAGLKSDRAPVLPGGLAILIAVFKQLGIDTMTAASGALREGLIHDLLGRIHHEDVRDQSVRRLIERYHVDVRQAERVARTAVALLEQIPPPDAGDGEPVRQLLEWAARLHESGLTVAHSGYHKHGAYLIKNAHMPGFSADDQAELAALILNHRRKLSGDPTAELAPHRAPVIRRLIIILRLAVLLNRSRSTSVVPQAAATDDGRVEVTFPHGYFAEHPLTLADLEQEASYLQAIDLALLFRESGS